MAALSVSATLSLAGSLLIISVTDSAAAVSVNSFNTKALNSDLVYSSMKQFLNDNKSWPNDEITNLSSLSYECAIKHDKLNNEEFYDKISVDIDNVKIDTYVETEPINTIKENDINTNDVNENDVNENEKHVPLKETVSNLPQYNSQVVDNKQNDKTIEELYEENAKLMLKLSSYHHWNHTNIDDVVKSINMNMSLLTNNVIKALNSISVNQNFSDIARCQQSIIKAVVKTEENILSTIKA